MKSPSRLSVFWALVFAVTLGVESRAYDLIKDSSGIYVVTWNPGTIAMKVKLPTAPALSDGTSQSGSVQEAMQGWNAKFDQVQLVPDQQAPGAYANGNGLSEIVMDSTIDGTAFGAGVLAVTASYRSGNTRTESDIIFNTAYTWDSYRGNMQTAIDLRRVAIHELGHVLGLDHPDQATPPQSVTAVMNSTISNIDTMQFDDIAGAQSLYGPPGFVPSNNNFSGATSIQLISSGAVQTSGTNVAATAEAGEPSHGGETARHTVWWQWTAPGIGNVTVTTLGSNFDTVLGVYTGPSAAALSAVASNDDVTSGTVRTSSVAFSSTTNTTYSLAVDGKGGAAGLIVFNLSFTSTAPPPVFTTRPLTRSLTVGDPVTFQAAATGSGALTYRWKRNGVSINGATGPTLALPSVTLADNGFYEVSAIDLNGTASSYFQVHVAPASLAVTGWGYDLYGQASLFPGLIPVVAVTGGYTHTLALKSDGTVVGCGTSGFPESIVPPGLSGVVAIAAQSNTSMALKSDGTVMVWGVNNFGQNTVPPGLADVIAIATGSTHCLALKADGTVVAWGEVIWGKTTVPAGLGGVVAIDAGTDHSIALKADGTVVVWGQNINHDSVTPPAGLSGVVAIAAGSNHNLALKADGSIVAWGFNPVGQTTIPVGATPAVAIAAGSSHSLALKADGTVIGWGYSNSGLGLDQSPPGLGVVYAIGTGDIHNLALVAPVAPAITGQPVNQTVNVTGTITLSVTASGIPTPDYQWRKGGVPLVNGGRIAGATSRTLVITSAQGGDAGTYDVQVSNHKGGVTSQPAVVTVTLLPHLPVRPLSRLVALGQPLTLDATAQAGATYSWVRNGQLLLESGPKLEIAGASASDAGYYNVQITNSAGTIRTLFYVRLARSNVISAWGANNFGQSTVPAGLADVADVSAGLAHSLALRADGSVAAWGLNDNGQTTVPPELNDVVQVSAGASHSVALKADGTVVAWGLNDRGQCAVPIGLAGVVFVSAGGAHTVALKDDGTLVAWGDNSHGQATIPANMQFAYYVSAGLTHNVALTYSGMQAWGRNNFNQSAPNNYTMASAVQAATDHTVFIDTTGYLLSWGKYSMIPTVSDAVVLSVRDTHGLLLKSNGTVLAWGPNVSGENILPAGLGNVQMVAAGLDYSIALVARSAPTIFSQPIDQTTNAGGAAVFAIDAGGASTYRWMREGIDLAEDARFSGTASPTLTIINAQAGDAGNYSVRLSNTFGSVTSQTVTLTVPTLLITNSAGVAANADGSLVTLGVTVAGAGSLTYQWYSGPTGDTSVPVAGGNTSSLTVPQTTAQNLYWVRVSNGVVSVDSANIPIGKWKVIDPLFGSAELSAVAYGDGKYVVVGTAVGHSANAIDWQMDTIEAGADLHAAIYDGTRFVAGGVRGQIFTSVDGIAWQKLRAADAGQYSENVLRSGAYANGISVFAGGRGQIMSSTDGLNWAWRPIGVSGQIIDLLSVAFGAGRFVAVGQGASGYQPQIYQSTDGINWSSGTYSLKPFSDYYALNGLSHVTYLGGKFVALGQTQNSGNPAYYMTSADGLTWTVPAFTNLPVSLNAMTLGNGQLLSGDFRISADGINWSAPQASPPRQLGSLGFGNGVFVALTSNSNNSYASILTSTDFQNWTTRVGVGVPSNVCYGSDRFVAVSRDRTAYSLDGVNWTVTGAAGYYDYGPVTFGNGLFVSTSIYSGYGQSHFTSPDGVTWTPRQIFMSGQTRALSLALYAGGQWVASTGEAIFTSADAISWTLRYPGGSMNLSALAYGDGRYVGVGYRGAVLFSDDAINWSAPLRPTTKNFATLAYGAGKFVATDTESGLWTSPDGLQWTARPLPAKNGGAYQGYISSLVYGGGRFLASYGSDVLSSVDGVSWQLTPSALPPPKNGYFFTSKLVFGADSFWASGSISPGPSTWLRAPIGPGFPEIISNPTDVVVSIGSTATLTVSASGPGLSYQWFVGSSGSTAQPIAGATSASYTTPGLTQTSQYWVRVSNGGGTVNGATVTVTVGAAPTISVQPADEDILAGAIANLAVIATGTPAPTYQWYRGVTGNTTQPIVSAIGGGFATPTTTTTVERYWVRVSNPAGSVDSATAVVTPWFERPALGTLAPFVFLNNRYIGGMGDRLVVSQNAVDWSVIQMNAPPMSCLAYGAGLYVGFRTSTSAGIYTSPDLLNWTLRPGAAGYENYAGTCVAFGGGRFVGGGDQGGVIVSTDGITWVRSSFSAGESQVYTSSVIYDGNGFIAVGEEPSTRSGVILRSADGVTWTRATVPPMGFGTELKMIARAGARLYAFGEFAQTSYTSIDGLVWSSMSVPPTHRIKSAAWLTGVYLLGTDSDSFYFSNDGLNWTEQPSPADLHTLSLISGPDQIVAAGGGSINSTADGLNWTLRAQTPTIGNGIGGISFGNGRFAVSGFWSDDYFSDDGTLWSLTHTPIGRQMGGPMAFGAGHFVCTDTDFPGKLWTSSDGSNWQAVTIPGIDHMFNNVGSANGLLFAFSSGGQYATSPDGLVWTVRSVGADTFLATVAYGNGRYVLAGSWKIWTSTDLSTWSESPVTRINVERLEFGRGMFVAAGNDSGGRILTSVDGFSWTERYAIATNAIYGLTFDGNRFAASGSGPLLLSRDGIHWSRGPVTVTHITDGQGSFVGAGERLWQSASELRLAPWIQSQPVARIVHWGVNVAFNITATGTDLTYQWRRNGVDLRDGVGVSGTKSATLLLSGTDVSDAGVYTVVVTNEVGSVTSEPVTLGTFVAPTITIQPGNRSSTTGSAVTFTSEASGTPAPTYQWQKGGVNIIGATNKAYSIVSTILGDAGSYRVLAINSEGTATSDEVTLAVGVPPAGFDLAGYFARYPAVAAVYGSNPYGAWLHYRDTGIYDGEVFDELFRVEEYLALYPDLFAIFGSDLGGALEHWLSTGRIEGKLGRIPLEFSAEGYFSRNPDVATAVGNDPILAWGHYWLYGIYEGRAYDDELRVFEYLAINADLTAAFVNDWRQAALHWMRYGRTEGRLGRLPLTFNVSEYLVRSPDVAATWGTNPTTVFLHYWAYGIDESRTYDDLFRPNEYLALNPDLAAALGTDRRLAFKHWVRYGQTEGRPGRNP